MNDQFAWLSATLKGRKTYIIGWLMVVDAVYFLVTGDRLFTSSATYDNGGAATDPAIQLLGGGALLTIRQAISGLVPPTQTPKE